MASAIRRARRISPSLQNATLIKLTNISPTATPADIRRLVLRSQIPGVEDVAIDNTFLEPNGSAFLTLAHPDYLVPRSLDALEMVTISGLHPIAEPSNRKPARALFQGSGLSSELKSDGKNVVVWGFPHILDPAALDQQALGGFSFPPGEDYIFKMPTTPKYSSCSRFMVRLASVPEAHRLVRQLHMTHWRPDYHGNKYLIRARVIY
ncbi:hypothetical protein C8F04DRAFT_1061239 [Mycena alexandri]|uniref:RRM domain-containing protein n=1 Tax=Mycena alexandri TaxID=1745969 RepID=A0AAD6XIT8_9AGAR|nr:hypothetical protein C8F04DRAFT_1061239 [Mycena alexandri]